MYNIMSVYLYVYIYIYICVCAHPPRTPPHVEQTIVLPALGLCIAQLMCLQKAMLVTLK